MQKVPWKDKLKQGLEKRLQPKELLKYLCPFELSFKLKMFQNVKDHDFAILFQAEGDTPFFDSPKDLESLLTQIMAERKSKIQTKVCEVKYDKEVYICLYVDFPKEEEKKREEQGQEKTSKEEKVQKT